MRARDQPLVIEPGGNIRHYWYDVWRYRELFLFLAWRDILVRYKQTVIGLAWSVLRPLLTMVVLTVVFGRLAKLPAGGVPYAIMVFSAMLPWQLFANALTSASDSLINNRAMVSKVYFPRLIVPGSAVVVGLVDFMLSFVILAFLMLWYRFVPDWRMLTVPLFLALALAAALGGGIWLSALNVQYRDFRHVVPFLVQFGLYVSPVGFSSSVVPADWRLPYSLNPMVGVIDGFRWSILGQTQLYVPGMLLSIGLTVAALWTGLSYFRRAERTFADVI